MLNNPLHSLQTAGLIGAIAFLALAPSPWDVSYLDWVKEQVQVEANATTTATATDANTPAAVDAIATRTATRYGIPKDVIMAIARHETGNFKAVIGVGNSWGLKCVGSHSSCVTTKTQEVVGGKVGSYRLAFESCEDVERCSRILGQTLTNLNTSGQWQDIPLALRSIGRRYATDPAWAEKVMQHLR